MLKDDKDATDASVPTLSPIELHVKNAIVQRTESGAFVIGAGWLLLIPLLCRLW